MGYLRSRFVDVILHPTDVGPRVYDPVMDDRDRAILDCEGRTWRSVGLKERAMRDLGMTPPAYYTRLVALLETRDALEYAPMTVTRLRRMWGTR